MSTSDRPTIPAYCDVPLCHAPCNGPLVTRAEHHRGNEYDPAHRLVCLNCGDGRHGTDAEVEQAERARDAWAAHEGRR
jgi:hypothetical protein